MINDEMRSTGVCEAKPTDPQMVIYPPGLQVSVWDPDGEQGHSTITISPLACEYCSCPWER